MHGTRLLSLYPQLLNHAVGPELIAGDIFEFDIKLLDESFIESATKHHQICVNLQFATFFDRKNVGSAVVRVRSKAIDFSDTVQFEALVDNAFWRGCSTGGKAPGAELKDFKGDGFARVHLEVVEGEAGSSPAIWFTQHQYGCEIRMQAFRTDEEFACPSVFVSLNRGDSFPGARRWIRDALGGEN